MDLAGPIIARAKPREIDREGGVLPAAGQPGAVVDEAQGAQRLYEAPARGGQKGGIARRQTWGQVLPFAY